MLLKSFCSRGRGIQKYSEDKTFQQTILTRFTCLSFNLSPREAERRTAQMNEQDREMGVSKGEIGMKDELKKFSNRGTFLPFQFIFLYLWLHCWYNYILSLLQHLLFHEKLSHCWYLLEHTFGRTYFTRNTVYNCKFHKACKGAYIFYVVLFQNIKTRCQSKDLFFMDCKKKFLFLTEKMFVSDSSWFHILTCFVFTWRKQTRLPLSCIHVKTFIKCFLPFQPFIRDVKLLIFCVASSDMAIHFNILCLFCSTCK